MPPPRSLESITEPRPTLVRAILSFVGSIGLVVLAFVAVGRTGQSVAADGSALISGTFAAPRDGAEPLRTAVRFATSEFAVRFLDTERVEMCIAGRVFDGYYRVEHGRVLIEAIEAPTPTRVWIFDIEGDRLVSGETVLERVAG